MPFWKLDLEEPSLGEQDYHELTGPAEYEYFPTGVKCPE